MLTAVVLGFLFGWIGSIPVAGPISALVVTRGLEGRFRAGVYISIGAGLAEAAYAFLAFWGFSTYLSKYPIIVPISRGAAAAVLFGLGVSFARMKMTAKASDEPPRDSAIANFMLGVSLCALNPTLIATWGATVTTLYSTDAIDFTSAQALPFAIGVCLGIGGWFLTLLWLIRKYKERFSHAKLSRAVRVVGYALILLSLWFAVRFVQYFMA